MIYIGIRGTQMGSSSQCIDRLLLINFHLKVIRTYISLRYQMPNASGARLGLESVSGKRLPTHTPRLFDRYSLNALILQGH